MNDIKEIGTQFECIKYAMRQTKEGFALTLILHPNDTPEAIMRDLVGQRYMAVFVRIDDNEEPVPDRRTDAGIKAVAMAGTLAADSRFQGWLVINDLADNANEESAAAAVRTYCGVTSRKELKVNAAARDKLYNLRDQFAVDLRK